MVGATVDYHDVPRRKCSHERRVRWFDYEERPVDVDVDRPVMLDGFELAAGVHVAVCISSVTVHACDRQGLARMPFICPRTWLYGIGVVAVHLRTRVAVCLSTARVCGPVSCEVGGSA